MSRPLRRPPGGLAFAGRAVRSAGAHHAADLECRKERKRHGRLPRGATRAAQGRQVGASSRICIHSLRRQHLHSAPLCEGDNSVLILHISHPHQDADLLALGAHLEAEGRRALR